VNEHSLPFDPIDEARRQWVDHGWAHAAAGMAAVTSIMRAQQIVLGRVDAVLRPLGLTFARYELLMLLEFSSAGSLPMRVIGERLQVHPTSVTSAVDRLETDGLVRRAAHPDDRRAVLVEILPGGREVAAQATERLNEEVFEDLGFGHQEERALTKLLGQLRQSAGDF
jgi:DNA-binding MarR family transcriptional regulator